MRYKKLGDTDLNISEVGLGTWNYKGGPGPLRRGVELGVNFIDTAEGYYTEGVVGEAVGEIRDEVVIATKVSGRHLDYDGVLRACEQSLEKLQTDFIDLYQIHWPNPSFPVKETMKAMERLVDEGVVRYVGVSNFSLDEMLEAQHFLPNYKIQSNQVLYNLNAREIEEDLLPYCADNKVTIIAYTPLDAGRLCETSDPDGSGKYKVLYEIARNNNKTPGQVSLNWCLRHKNVVVIPKSNSVERTEENCGASGWDLIEEQDVQKLNDVF